MQYNALANLAEDAVRRASGVCGWVQDQIAGRSITKGDKSPVTVADYAAQAIVSLTLSAGAADIPLVGEEDASDLREGAHSAHRAEVLQLVRRVFPDVSEGQVMDAIDRGVHGGGATGRHWVLDPIDGTKGFLRGGQYAVALGLVEEGEVVVGVLGCPNLDPGGTLFSAIRGGGARTGTMGEAITRPIAVSAESKASAARFCESVEAAHSAHDWSASIAAKLGVTAEPYRIDSQCKYAAVARGDAAIYLRLPTRKGYVEKIWDHAAGYLIVTEAGGKVTDIKGAPLDISRGRLLELNRGVVATNGRLHDEVLAAVAATHTPTP